MPKPIRVIVVDDSALMRNMLSTILDEDPGIQVVATAIDPYDAREKIKTFNPDVITLDIEMPKMNGLDFLEKIMKLRPMPVVMFSTLTQKNANETIRALEIGAVDVIGKPSGGDFDSIQHLAPEITSKVKLAASARVKQSSDGNASAASSTLISHTPSIKNREQLIAIGSSTGGVEALKQIFACLPATLPPIVVTQHMPEMFVPSFANRLNEQSKIGVCVAANGMILEPGHAYVAPGDKHLVLRRKGDKYGALIDDRPKVSGHKPSVDVMFHSVAEIVGEKAIGAILTGMGSDGASGMLHMLQNGAYTIGQNEASCVVYGMPKQAFEMGAVKIQVSLSEIAKHIVKQC